MYFYVTHSFNDEYPRIENIVKLLLLYFIKCSKHLNYVFNLSVFL